jgi:hypothetical protein
MLKASSQTKDGRPVMLFGLSAMNLKRLKEGKPIRINAAAEGLPFAGEILIFYGRTEHDMIEDWHQFIGPDTKTRIDPRSL